MQIDGPKVGAFHRSIDGLFDFEEKIRSRRGTTLKIPTKSFA
jgi:hypothetical protein